MISIEHTEVIKNNVKNSLDKFNLTFNISLENNGKSIRVTGYNEELFMWIRILPDLSCENGNKYIVDLNNINIPLKLRNKHIFTTVYERLSNCKYVSEVRVTSICTDMMRFWCEKNGLYSINGYDYSSRKRKVEQIKWN